MKQWALGVGLVALLVVGGVHAAIAVAQEKELSGPARQSDPIPFDQLGAAAEKQYSGDGLAVVATADGARLRSVFQKIEADATREGLWITSTAPGEGGRLRLIASAVGRDDSVTTLPATGTVSVAEKTASFRRPGLARLSENSPRFAQTKASPFEKGGLRGIFPNDPHQNPPWPPFSKGGKRSSSENRQVLTEEYSVSADGVRQDFVVAERPPGTGELRLELALSGARAEAAAAANSPLEKGALMPFDSAQDMLRELHPEQGRRAQHERERPYETRGSAHPEALEGRAESLSARAAKLTLDGSGRALVYSRLRAVDATGRELAATMDVVAADRLALRVDDAGAAYPVRIDPTFSDADWVSLNPGVPGTNDYVWAAVADGSGNLYIGGRFTFVGTVSANNIAKWNGSAWSALGSGMNNWVVALAVIGSDLYAGGFFTAAGGVSANYIAKWDGSAWAALGSGMNDSVVAMAVAAAMCMRVATSPRQAE
jgi:hypothetical protein